MRMCAILGMSRSATPDTSRSAILGTSRSAALGMSRSATLDTSRSAAPSTRGSAPRIPTESKYIYMSTGEDGNNISSFYL